MIAGVRGSGKTVSLSVIADHYAERNDWFVLRLSADSDLIAGAISELNRVVGLSGKADIRNPLRYLLMNAVASRSVSGSFQLPLT